MSSLTPADAFFSQTASWLVYVLPCLSRRRSPTPDHAASEETPTAQAVPEQPWQEPHEHTPLLPSPAPQLSSPVRGMTAPSAFAPPRSVSAELLGQTMSKLSGAYILLPRERPTPSIRSPPTGRSRSSTTSLWLTRHPGTPVEPKYDGPAMRRMHSLKGVVRDPGTANAAPPSTACPGVNQLLSSYSFGKAPAAQMLSAPSPVALHLNAPSNRRGGHRRGNPSWPNPLNPIRDVSSGDVPPPAAGTAMQLSPSDSTVATNATTLSGSTSTSPIPTTESAPHRRSASSTTPLKVDPSRVLVPVTPMPWVRFRAGTNESMTRASLGSLPGLSACSSASLSDHAGPVAASARDSVHSLQATAGDSDTSTPQSVYQPRLITLDLCLPAGSPLAASKAGGQAASDDDSASKSTPSGPSARSKSGLRTPRVPRDGGENPLARPGPASGKICSTSDVSSGAASTPTPNPARVARAVAAIIPRLGWSTSPGSHGTQVRLSPSSSGSTASRAGVGTANLLRAGSRPSPPSRGNSSSYRAKSPSSDTELMPWHPTMGFSSNALVAGSIGSDN